MGNLTNWPLRGKPSSELRLCFVSGTSSCVYTVSSVWQGHWYGLFLGPPATTLNLVLILGAWWRCLFWWGWAECGGMLCVGRHTRAHACACAQTFTLTSSSVRGQWMNSWKLNEGDNRQVNFFAFPYMEEYSVGFYSSYFYFPVDWHLVDKLNSWSTENCDNPLIV